MALQRNQNIEIHHQSIDGNRGVLINRQRDEKLEIKHHRDDAGRERGLVFGDLILGALQLSFRALFAGVHIGELFLRGERWKEECR